MKRCIGIFMGLLSLMGFTQKNNWNKVPKNFLKKIYNFCYTNLRKKYSRFCIESAIRKSFKIERRTQLGDKAQLSKIAYLKTTLIS